MIKIFPGPCDSELETCAELCSAANILINEAKGPLARRATDGDALAQGLPFGG